MLWVLKNGHPGTKGSMKVGEAGGELGLIEIYKVEESRRQ